MENAPTDTLHCDMTKYCDQQVTMIDRSGFAYCTDHGLRRRMYEPCRKLRPAELKRLLRGETIGRY